MKLPFMKLFTSDYRDGTAELTFEQSGFYMACLTFLHDGETLPADPQLLSRKLRCNARTVRKIVPKLIEMGKLIERNGCLYNARVLRDLGLKLPPEDVPSEPIEADFEANSSAIRAQFEPNSSGIRGECSEKPNEITVDKFPTSRSHIPEAIYSPTPPRGMPTFPTDHRTVSAVELVDDQIVLRNGTKELWLQQFGGSQSDLELALIEVRGFIQPNSRAHDLKTQVERQLARIVRDRRDRDRRYAEAAERNRPAAPSPASKAHPTWVRI